MDDSIVDTKPIISVETTVDSNNDNVLKSDVNESTANEESVANEQMEANEEPIADTEEQRIEAEEKMEVESGLESDKHLPQISVQPDEQKVADIEDNSSVAKNAINESEVSVAVEETNGEEVSKVSEAVVEPMPDLSVKSPTDIANVVEKISSPSAVPASQTPPRSQTNKKPKADLTSVPVRQYLDTTVVPILLQGLSSLARERPQKPISFLANFLLDKASEYDED